MRLTTAIAAAGIAATAAVGVLLVAPTLVGGAASASRSVGLTDGSAEVNLAALAADHSALDLATASGGANTDRLRLRVQHACGRVPGALTRADNLQKRLDGDASTPGSLAALQVKIDKAKAAGHSELATALASRLKLRQDLLALLPQRVALLKQAQQTICADLPATSSNGTT